MPDNANPEPLRKLKILVLSDLHYNKTWYDWVKTAAPRHHLVAIAGDLLDGRSDDGLLRQIIWLDDWQRGFPSNLAVCSGNHDANEPNPAMEPLDGEGLSEREMETARSAFLAERWMDILGSHGTVTDNRTQLVQTKGGGIVVSTIPYDDAEGTEHEDLWKRGHLLRSNHSCPWVLLSHAPPSRTAVGGDGGSVVLRRQIGIYQPDYVLSGHLHHQPYEGSFIDRVGKTWCFNPGAAKNTLPASPEPNHITLDIKAATASWRATWEGDPALRISSRSLSGI